MCCVHVLVQYEYTIHRVHIFLSRKTRLNSQNHIEAHYTRLVMGNHDNEYETSKDASVKLIR
jgi:hypothetical protein